MLVSIVNYIHSMIDQACSSDRSRDWHGCVKLNRYTAYVGVLGTEGRTDRDI